MTIELPSTPLTSPQVDFSPGSKREDSWTPIKQFIDNEDLAVEEAPAEDYHAIAEDFERCLERSVEYICDLRSQLESADITQPVVVDWEVRALEDQQLLSELNAALQAAHERLATLQAQVEQLSKPWWKKLFG